MNNFLFYFITLITTLILINTIYLIPKRFNNSFVKFLKSKLNFFSFGIGFILGLIVYLINGQTIFNRNSQEWLLKAVEINYGIINYFVLFLLTTLLIMLPFQFLKNLIKEKVTFRKTFSLIIFYLIFGGIAVLVCLLMYFFKDSFYGYDSNVSKILDQINDPIFNFYKSSLFLYKNFILKREFTFWFGIGLAILLLILFCFSFLIKKINQQNSFLKINNKVFKLRWIAKLITPNISFLAIFLSMATTSVGTVLHFLVVLLIVTILAIIFTISIQLATWSLGVESPKSIWLLCCRNLSLCHHQTHQEKYHSYLQGYLNNKYQTQVIVKKENHLLVNVIFPIVFMAYLGFSSGVIWDLTISESLWFWFGIYLGGLFMIFIYGFDENAKSESKAVFSLWTPYIITGLNTGIFNLFYPYFDIISKYNSIQIDTFIAIKEIKKEIKWQKSILKSKI